MLEARDAAEVHAHGGRTHLQLPRADGCVFLVVADEEFGRQVPFACLERIAGDFKEAYGDRARDAIAHSLDRAFGPKLQAPLSTAPTAASKVSRVQQQVSEVKEIMMDNIEKVLDPGRRSSCWWTRRRTCGFRRTTSTARGGRFGGGCGGKTSR